MSGTAALPWVTVILVNYNGGALIQAALDSLAAQTDPDFVALVLDNASTDGSAERLILPDPRFRLLRAPANLGFAAGNNHAAREARTPWLATLNPDARADPDWLAALARAIRRHPGVAMFGSLQRDGTRPGLIDGCGDVLSVCGIPWRGGTGRPLAAAPAADGEAFAPCAAAALYRADAFRAVGGFDPHFFCYIEDVDLGFRLRLAGHRCIQVADARVTHLASALCGRASDFTLFHSHRNRIRMVARCLPGPLLAPGLALHLAATLHLLIRGRAPAAAWRGFAAGLRGLPAALADRARVQAGRRAGTLEIARALNWRPGDLRRRPIDLRPARHAP